MNSPSRTSIAQTVLIILSTVELSFGAVAGGIRGIQPAASPAHSAPTDSMFTGKGGGKNEGGGEVNLTLIPVTGPVQPNDPDLAFLFADAHEEKKPKSANANSPTPATRPVALNEGQAVARMQQRNHPDDVRLAARNTPTPMAGATH